MSRPLPASGARIAWPIGLLVACALGLNVFLNLGKWEHTASELESSRLAFVLTDARREIETGLDLGLALERLANAQAIVDQAAAKDRVIESISIFDARGGVLFVSSGAVAPDAMPWLAETRRATGKVWRLDERDANVVGIALTDNLGLEVGGIALRYSNTARRQALAAITRDLGVTALAIGAVTLLLALLGIRWLDARREAALRHGEELVDAVAGGKAPLVRNDDERLLAATASVIHSALDAGLHPPAGTPDKRPAGDGS